MNAPPEGPPGEASPPGVAAPARGLLDRCKAAANRALLTPVSALARVGVIKPDQWSDIRKQVVSSVLVALLVGGVPALYSSWDRLFPESAPPPFGGLKIGILVAKLDGDSSGTHQTHVLRTLQRMFTAGGEAQAELRAYPRALILNRSQEIFAGEREVSERGRAWLKEQNADFLVWGETAGTDVLRLRILGRAAQTDLSPLEMSPYRLDSESFLLPTTFSEDFGRLLNAFANTLALRSVNSDDPRLLEVLQPVERRLRTMFDHPPRAIKPGDRAEIGIALASVLDAMALRSGAPDRFQNVVRFYEGLDALAASSGDAGVMGRYAFNFGVFLFREGAVREDVPIVRRGLAMFDKALVHWTREANRTEWMQAKLFLCVGSQAVAIMVKDAATFERLSADCVPFFREEEVTRTLFPRFELAPAVSRVETLICRLQTRRAGFFMSADLFDRALADCRASEQRIAQYVQGTRPVFYLTSVAEEIFALYNVHRNDELILRTAAELRELHKKIAPNLAPELTQYAAAIACAARMREASVQGTALPIDVIKTVCDASLRRPVLRGYSEVLEAGRGDLLVAVSDNLFLSWPRLRDLQRIELVAEYVALLKAAYASNIMLPVVGKILDCIVLLPRMRIAAADDEAIAQLDNCAEAFRRISTEALPSYPTRFYDTYTAFVRAYRARLVGEHANLAKAKEEYVALLAGAKTELTSVQTQYLADLGSEIDLMIAELNAKQMRKLH